MRSLIALIAFFGPGLALAAPTDDLNELASDADQLDAVARGIDRRVGSGGGTELDPEEAKARFETYLFYMIVGRNEEAAEGFFGLVTTGALKDPAVHRDAEWYLAESLYGMGNTVTAEARYKLITEDAAHPFRPDAVRRLLQLYAEKEDFDAFYKLYDSEIVQGRVQPTSAITYTIAKSFYQQGDFAKATKYFGDILPEKPEYSRARYFMGVVKIREGDAVGGLPFFAEAAAAPVTSVEARRVHDLALLAQARIAYERGEFLDAAVNYQKVGSDSDYLDDVLFEQSWSWIKQDRYDEALQSVEIFLLAFPEHRYAGDLRVIEGHLHMGCAQTPTRCPDPSLAIEQGDAYQQALSKYEGIVEDYSPIRDAFADLGSSDDKALGHFKTNLTLEGPGDGKVPEFALAMMRDDESLDRTIEIAKRLESQERDLEVADQIIEEIRAVLSTDNGSGGFEGARYEAIANQARVGEAQIRLMQVESAWLASEGVDVASTAGQLSTVASMAAGARQRVEAASQKRDKHLENLEVLRAQMRPIQDAIAAKNESIAALEVKLTQVGPREGRKVQEEIDALKAGIVTDNQRFEDVQRQMSAAQMPTADLAADTSMATLNQAVAALHESYVALRPRKPGLSTDIDLVFQRLERLQIKFDGILGRMSKVGGNDLTKVRERFDAEVAEVERERADVIRERAEADRLAASVTRAGLGRMEAFFADSVMKADTGIVDVYWSRKLELAEQREQIQEERNAVVDELERRFALIRQKMEQ